MNTAPDAPPEFLRADMVDQIVKARPRSARVEKVMHTVPRHRFLPETLLKDAYAPNKAVITKRAADGTALSCSSVPTLVATMLDQLNVEPGDRILEIGAGTGINAAYLAELTGRSGHVTTVDIDPQVTAQARQALDANGYGHIQVITRDGALGAAEHAPFDRIIVTVGAWDIPPAWWDQLRPGGRLVVPLRWRGQTRSIALTHGDQQLRSDSVELCGFVPMIGQPGEHSATIDAGQRVTLYWDTDQPINPSDLQGVLNHPKTATWSSVTVGPNEPFDGVWLRLTATEPGTCRIAASTEAVETGLCMPAIAIRSPAIAENASLAYFAQRRLDDEDTGRRWELGAIGHGPKGPELAERLADQIRAWSHNRTCHPLITIAPPSARPGLPRDEGAIEKPGAHLKIEY
ncbi:methyltransferase, FxLD system [Actinomadura rubrisoli]|uniref:Protein-L-isoaspartate O-methyltransferase n=1 Tax=Actinomadura rubrisoli TaxID=2530368 RepID=A0A4R5B507_9ACTN|nr:methyltransferase, FxLD system [Actinomadura rubrisoli]TDD79660.1 methyltransferase, FxLD system [Actinomadura rubrisoli]